MRNHLSLLLKIVLAGACACYVVIIVGCGIKGPPRAPSIPPELGRGRPTYKGATKKFINEGTSLLVNDKESEEKDDEQQ